MKKLLTALLCLAILVCAVPFSALAAEGTAEEIAASLELTVLPGASVRKTEGTTGIRFDTTLSRAGYDALVEEGYTLTHGTLIVPASYLSSVSTEGYDNLYDALKGSGKTVADIVSDGFYTPAAGDTDFEDVNTEEVYIFRSALTNLQDHNYVTDFLPVSYVLVEKSGARVATACTTPDAEESSRSIYEVASKAFAAGETDEVIRGFVNSVLDVTVDRFGTITQNDVTGDAAGRYAPTYAKDTVTVANGFAMKALLFNGTALPTAYLETLDCFSYDEETMDAKITLSDLLMTLSDPVAVRNAADMTASYSDTANQYPLDSECWYEITSTASAKADVNIRVTETNLNWRTIEFSFKMEKPSEISSTERTVLNLLLYRTAIASSVYMLTVEAYDDYFRFGDQKENNGASGEFNQDFAYDTWYTVRIYKSSTNNSAPAWKLTYGTGKGVEATNAVTYGTSAAASSNNYYRTSDGWSSMHGLKLTATADSSFSFSVDDILFADENKNLSNENYYLFLSCSSLTTSATQNPAAIDLANAGTTGTGVVVAIDYEKPSDVDQYYATSTNSTLTWNADTAEGWNVAVVDFKVRFHSMSKNDGMTGMRGITFYALNGSNGAMMKTNFGLYQGSTENNALALQNTAVKYGDWTDIRLYYIWCDAPAEGESKTDDDCKTVIYINGIFFDEYYGAVDQNYTYNGAPTFNGIRLQNYGNSTVVMDFADFTYTFYNMD